MQFLPLCISNLVVSASEKELVYFGESSVVINDNDPLFTDTEIATSSYEEYGELDKFGRCTTVIACIGQDLMPTEDRGSIGMIKPTGWKQNKYEGIVNSDPPYLYNRCHLIGFQLTGENANERNLVTGTRYMNVEGMLPYENIVASYIKGSGNHVMYRVTPVFNDSNLLCNGVIIEALSVEDKGKGISFNVFCFNVQPGVIIDYKDGSNQADPNYLADTLEKDNEFNEQTPEQPLDSNVITGSYVANKNTKKFHYSWCSSVEAMKEKNKLYHNGPRDELINNGYVPCKNCNP